MKACKFKPGHIDQWHWIELLFVRHCNKSENLKTKPRGTGEDGSIGKVLAVKQGDLGSDLQHLGIGSMYSQS